MKIQRLSSSSRLDQPNLRTACSRRITTNNGNNFITAFMAVPAMRISAITRGKRSISPDTAIRLGKALNTTPEYWLKLQAFYDIETARDAAGDNAFDAVKRVA